jgi:hypothetical protein
MYRRYVPSEPKNHKNTVGSKYPVPLEREREADRAKGGREDREREKR